MGHGPESEASRGQIPDQQQKSKSLVQLLRGDRFIRLRQFMIPDNTRRGKMLIEFTPGDALKVETNALGAMFLEEAWEFVKEARTRMIDAGSPHGLGSFEDGVLIPDGPNPFTPFIYTGISQFVDVARDGFNKWQAKRDSQKTDQKDDKVQAYNRFKHVLKKRKITPIDTKKERDLTPTDFFMAGIGTSTLTMLGTIEMIPLIFRRKYGRGITRSEFIEIANNSIRPIAILAAGNLETSNRIGNRFGFRSATDLEESVPLDVKSFDIVNKNGELSLSLNERRVKRLRNTNGRRILDAELPNITTGCLALAAMSNGKNIIREMWEDWVLPAATEYYISLFPEFPQDTLISRLKTSSKQLRRTTTA